MEGFWHCVSDCFSFYLSFPLLFTRATVSPQSNSALSYIEYTGSPPANDTNAKSIININA